MENRIEIAADENDSNVICMRRYYHNIEQWAWHGVELEFPTFGPDNPLRSITFSVRIAPPAETLGDGVHDWEHENET